jgi:hypothetical protein
MPIDKVKGGYRVRNTKTVHKTKSAAQKQLVAIKINQKRKRK